MAGIGVRRPFYAKYDYNPAGGQVMYRDGGVFGKAVSFTANINMSGDNILYADDAPAEVDTFFSGGTLDMTVDDLSDTVKQEVFGAKVQPVTGGSGGTELIFDESQVIPDIGFGVIITKSIRGVIAYRAVIFPKVKMNQISTEAATKGEQITWQTQALTGMILRDDTETHMWKREATFTREGDAIQYIVSTLNIPMVI